MPFIPENLLKVAYLTSPYTSIDVRRQHHRAQVAAFFAAELCVHYAVFSPIAHGTRLEPNLPTRMAKSHEFWMKQCYPLLAKADELIICPMPGWRESKGVQLEILFADQRGIPTKIIDSEYYNLERVTGKECLEKGWGVVCL